jgi:carboxypeptidase Q
MKKSLSSLLLFAVTTVAAAAPGTNEEQAMLSRIAERGRDQSQIREDAHQLMDVIGPRLTASPADLAAHDWMLQTYRRMGLESWNAAYGTLPGWRRGTTHVDLIYPRVRTLEAMALAWSPGTKGAVEAPVVVLPRLASPDEFKQWLPAVRGAYVLASVPDTSCRPIEDWKAYAKPEVVERMQAERAKAYADWLATFDRIGVSPQQFPKTVEAAGAAGILVRNWWKDPQIDPGSSESSPPASASVIMDGSSEQTPMVNLGCEDYGLLWRLTEGGSHPRIRVAVDAESLGDAPVEETLAKIPGVEQPDQVIVLTAHLDSWDAGSGATDNGTGTLRMLEAMRILRDLYPKPRRTILVRHWSGEEQGFIPPEMPGLQLRFNQDVGTGRAASLFLRGLPAMREVLEGFVHRLPAAAGANLAIVGPEKTNLDSATKACSGVAVVNLWPSNKTGDPWSLTWSYYHTWHTNRDSYDKIVFDEVQADAALLAMLAYLASEYPDAFPQAARNLTDPKTGQALDLPPCVPKAQGHA